MKTFWITTRDIGPTLANGKWYPYDLNFKPFAACQDADLILQSMFVIF